MNAPHLKYPGPKSGGKVPARLHRRLRGDLDNIVLKALRKEPERRYVSAEQLADDIRRHLQGLPVSATPDSVPYRARKFLRRHRIGVTAIVLIMVAVTGGIMATLREARIAAANQQRAEKRFNDVRRLANSLMFEIHDSIRDLPGSTPARRLLVTRALEYLDGLSQQSQGDVSLQKELAAAYERVGDVLGYPYAANLGDPPGALRSYQKALAMREPLAAADPGNTQLQSELAGNYMRLAQVMESGGDFQGALAAVRKALPITQNLAAANNNPERADLLAGSYYFAAGLLLQTGDPDGAAENFQHAASIRQAALETEPGNLLLRTHLAADYAGQAKSLAQKGDLARALQTQGRAITILEQVSRANPDNATLREYLGEALSRIAQFRYDQGNAGGALDAYRKAHEIFQYLLAVDAKNSLARSNFAFTDNGIGRSLVALGKPASAIKFFSEAAATFEDMSPRTARNRYLRSGLADSYFELGRTYCDLAAGGSMPASKNRQYREQAGSSCQKSLALWKQKQQLGELESDERGEPQRVAQCVAQCR